jgi:hypothetical protein
MFYALVGRMPQQTGKEKRREPLGSRRFVLQNDPEKWKPISRKDHVRPECAAVRAAAAGRTVTSSLPP